MKAICRFVALILFCASLVLGIIAIKTDSLLSWAISIGAIIVAITIDKPNNSNT